MIMDVTQLCPCAGLCREDGTRTHDTLITSRLYQLSYLACTTRASRWAWSKNNKLLTYESMVTSWMSRRSDLATLLASLSADETSNSFNFNFLLVNYEENSSVGSGKSNPTPPIVYAILSRLFRTLPIITY